MNWFYSGTLFLDKSHSMSLIAGTQTSVIQEQPFSSLFLCTSYTWGLLN